MVGLVSDIGMVRSLNEDYARYFECEDFKIYVVADGMGGHNAGEVASKMAVDGIIEYIQENFNTINSDEILKKSIEKVNRDIHEFSVSRESLKGMGTTITACITLKDKIQVGNVGDSSCYGINGQTIAKITKDHSLVQELVDIGTITESEAFNHPKKNIITRAVGTNEQVDVDIFTVDKGVYDIFIICSDGLTNEVTKEEVVSVINEEKELIHACERLVSMAKYKGGRDNITVLLFGGEI